MTAKDPLRVPARLRPRFDEITALTDRAAVEHLDEEYAELCRRMAAALARKRPSPLERGTPRTWAAGILGAVGWVNFLSDPAQDPHLTATELAEAMGVGKSTIAAKTGEIRDLLQLIRLEPEWTLPSRMDDNPLAWLIVVDGVAMDAREAPPEIQEEALRVGAIPYLPAARPAAPQGGRSSPRRVGRGGPEAERVFQIRVVLSEIEPPVWRRLLVPEATTLAGLHRVIQAAMGWEDCHLYRFEIGGVEYGESYEDGWDFGDPLRSARETRLRDVASPGDVLLYEYDFGDSWEHRIRVEKLLPAEPGREYPVCIGAERACPPEDVGGVGGYAEFLEVMADPSHPDHEGMLEWAGDDFHPDAVDLGAIEAQLRHTRPTATEGGWAPGAFDEMDEFDELDEAWAAEEQGDLFFNSAEAVMRGVRSRAEEVLQEALNANPDATADDLTEALNAALGTMSGGYNARPHPDLRGLTPDQARRLFAADWESDRSAVRLNESLSFEEIGNARTPHNTSLLLRLLAEAGGAKATTKGNLPRTIVAAAYDQIRWPMGRRSDWLDQRKVLNEEEVFPLHVARVLLELAGCIELRSGRFVLTELGERWLGAEGAGEFFAELFRTHFRRLNLAYLDRAEPVPGFQHTVAFTLYRFATEGSDWRTADDLAGTLVHRDIRGELPPGERGDLDFRIIAETRFLRPLEGFGLAESRAVPRDPPSWGNDYEYRKSPLFDRFVEFRLDGD
jgi:hypothetical protein